MHEALPQISQRNGAEVLCDQQRGDHVLGEVVQWSPHSRRHESPKDALSARCWRFLTWNEIITSIPNNQQEERRTPQLFLKFVVLFLEPM